MRRDYSVFKQKKATSSKKKPTNWMNLFVFVLLFAAVPLTVAIVQRFASLLLKADTPTITFQIIPKTSNFPPNQTVQVWLNAATYKPVFVSAEINFDPAVVQLSDEVGVTSAYTSVISKTTKSEANTTGKVKLVVVSTPDDVTNNRVPTGYFQLASLPFMSMTTQLNVTTSVTVNVQNSQVVDNGGAAMVIQSVPGTIALNVPTPTNTPIVQPTAIPTAGSTVAPTINPTSKPTSVPSVNPTATPRVKGNKGNGGKK